MSSGHGGGPHPSVTWTHRATERATVMRIVLSDFVSLDGVVQSPGGQGEDTGGGFAHGGWSQPYFEPETMGPAVAEVMAATDALPFGRRTWQTGLSAAARRRRGGAATPSPGATRA